MSSQLRWAARPAPLAPTRGLARKGRNVAARVASKPLAVPVPPADYDYHVDVDATTRSVIEGEFPELMDLVEEGSLVVWTRPEGYVERRTDGYREPERVLIVGTAHVSEKSAADVTRVVQAVNPENVVVELCKSRAAIMYDDPSKSGEDNAGEPTARNPMSLGGNSLIGAMQRSLSLGGETALVLRLLLGGMSDRLATSMDVQRGGEFRAARIAAEASGLQIVLGDRPIEITLQRAWDSLTWDRRRQLCSELFAGMNAQMPQVDQAMIEKMKADEVVSAFFSVMASSYPELLNPLIHERDLYLAWSLRRSKAVNGTRTVVGVMGKGHLRGVVYALGADSHELRFRDLVGGKNVKRNRQADMRNGIIKFVVETILFTAALWALAQVYPF